ncbi:MAG: class 1 fructose-bisphosphatase [Sulfurospirillum sp.]
MIDKPLGITVSRYIMDLQHMFPEAKGDLTGLLNELIVAAKTINAEVNKAGLADILGQSGKKNIQGEEVQNLDELTNNTIKKRMESCSYVCAMVSEEEEKVIPVKEGYSGKYTLAFDPLDGSSNIDVNVSIGTIFSIHRRVTSSWDTSSYDVPGTADDFLQKGSKQVAAGYILYGSSTMMVFTTGHGVNGFTLDPSVGEFYLSHKDIKIPKKCKYLSVNEGNCRYWDENMQKYINHIKDSEISSRYIGSLVADFHRNLISGGIFLYPKDKKDPNKKSGKLRLLYEAAPLAFLAEQAGGLAMNDEGENILDIQPTSIHQRTPLVIGNKKTVLEAVKFLKEV